jgi:hypothetical protein
MNLDCAHLMDHHHRLHSEVILDISIQISLKLCGEACRSQHMEKDAHE